MFVSQNKDNFIVMKLDDKMNTCELTVQLKKH